MTWCIDQVERVLQAIPGRVREGYRLAFNGYAALAFDVHVVEHLRLQLALVNDFGAFYEPVGQRRFSVVDMGYDTKIAGAGHVVHEENVTRTSHLVQ